MTTLNWAIILQWLCPSNRNQTPSRCGGAISPEEQLIRFRQRLDDPARHWKISENDYTERDLWDDYISAYEEAIRKTSMKHAPWFIIPAQISKAPRPRTQKRPTKQTKQP